ncbi:MAG: 2-(1,2-epoxy-1,2-dihydrophenyl)acetyl-CoA isomerase [Alphaproteobacteria bacterium]|nr:2-(1,2-epoxy-1,2-dihydrophenyl)acetyl-CoA isomerase [Alphaproteobacteria bacterium]
MTTPSVTLCLDSGVATITLNRPDKLNSFTETMHGELLAVLTQLASDETVRALLLTGAGRGFCAGQDLSDPIMRTGPDALDMGETIDRLYNRLIRALKALQVPVICAVNGVAAGAGANLALACDIVLAARSASFIQAFAKIGLVPDSGGTWFLPRLVGPARAMALSLLGEKISAEQALQWGMIWKVVDDAQLMDEARGLALHLARQPTKALGLIKQALNATWSHRLDEQLDLERDLQRKASKSPDYAEGVAAFMAKRPAEFTGK